MCLTEPTARIPISSSRIADNASLVSIGRKVGVRRYARFSWVVMLLLIIAIIVSSSWLLAVQLSDGKCVKVRCSTP